MVLTVKNNAGHELSISNEAGDIVVEVELEVELEGLSCGYYSEWRFPYDQFVSIILQLPGVREELVAQLVLDTTKG
jgi:hypothetical protein